MGNDDHGGAFFRELLHNIQNLSDHLGVESGRRLVKEHHIGLHAQGAHDGDTLLLSAGELRGISIGAVCETYALQKLHRLGVGFFLALFQQLLRTDGHVAQDGHIREEVEVLEHHAHLLAVLVDVNVRLGDIDSLEEDLARGWELEKIERAKEGGFAGAGGADDDDDLTAADLHAHAVEGVDGTFLKVLLQVVDLYQNIIVHSFSASSQLYLPAMSAA